ncbi:MAG: YraN family protein [Gemmatimonadaceae bacterium]
MTNANQAVGEAGERYAEAWLVARGWTVRARRFRSGHRDLDLIVERGDTIAFVEVKARHGSRFGHPVEAVDWRKQRQLIRSAQVWADRYGRNDQAFRFDVVGVLIEGNRARIRHIENAFAMSNRP